MIDLLELLNKFTTNMGSDLFKDRKLLIATKHKKEQVIAPLLEEYLGVVCFVDHTFDTDTLGTFTGEVERKLNPIEAARKKCLLAMEVSNVDLVIASEGSFAPHPTMFFANADEEFLVLIDKKNNLEIVARELSLDTNFNASLIPSEEELLEFAELVNFPSHGLILRKSKSNFEGISKGISDIETLKKAYKNIEGNEAYVETDMRAMYNPTRMKVIETATKKLIDKVTSCCPNCDMPGFEITDTKPGLPCNLCGSDTQSILSVTYSCKHCNFTEEKMYPNGKETEDPTYCNYCNP